MGKGLSMTYDFDRVVDRRSTNSVKWQLYGPGILPLWVADMDFPAPEPILEALQRAVDHGIFGYEMASRDLGATVAARMESLYGWKAPPESVVATPGVIAGFVAAAHALCAAGDGILVQPPVYPPFLSVHEKAGLVRQDAPLARQDAHSHRMAYALDWSAFEEAFGSHGTHTGMFLLCNPHNPTGQMYTRDELTRMAQACLAHGAFIVSDEIHSELLLGDARHVPIASLDPAIAARSITLVAPSKTYNIPGLFCAFAIVPDPGLRERYKKTIERMAMHVGSPGLLAARVAYSGACDDWLADLRVYLAANRDFLVDFVGRELPGIRTTVPSATYLAWLDCNDLIRSGRVAGSPHKFFLHEAKVALNEGAEFGQGGQGFVRLNFGCPRATLAEALERMKTALLPGLPGAEL